jgi:7-cyano-7-deazaguanine reductase
MEKFKSLKKKQEFQFLQPDPDILESFSNPGVQSVTLTSTEFTSLCPITGQPDYATIKIHYQPQGRCVESKSLKLYLGSYRNYGAFAETLAKRISLDLSNLLTCTVTVTVTFQSRGGIIIQAESRSNGEIE